ncbi:MAG: amidohydrolase family protein [Treponema sp.]|nr:amidohydrolase family protein [Treponema sp.]
MHITPPEISENPKKYAKKEPYFAMLSKNPHNRYASAEDIIASFEDGVIDHAVVFGFAFKDLGLCRLVNDYVIEKVKEFPEKLTGFMSISPNVRGMEREIARCYDAGLRGIGEIYPEGQRINIDNKKETAPLISACLERDMPLIVHVNEPVGHYYHGKSDIPLKKIEKFIENSMGAKIVLAHWGGGIFLYETMKEIKEKFTNVYYDIAATPFLYDERIYNSAKALGLCEKILFASDFPLLPQSRYMEGLEKSNLSAEEKRLILSENAKRLLGLCN